jgi:phage anti-repressor protein/predicted GIY-YIG superfamily endonuclease
MELLKEQMYTNVVDKKFVDKFYDSLIDYTKMINYTDVKEWVGYRKKQTVLDILKNDKYSFKENIDYSITQYKPGNGRPGTNICMTIDTIKCLCLMSDSEKGHQFRKYYIEMEKLYKQYVSTIIKNQLTNPIPQINQHNFDITSYANKEVLYLIYVKDNLYKFGVTRDIQRRLNEHERYLEYKHIVKIWDCKNNSISKKAEQRIKDYSKMNKINDKYKGFTELIKSSDIFNIVKVIDVFVSEEIEEYEKQFINKELEQKMKLAENMAKITQNMLEFAKHSNNQENNTIMMNNLIKSFGISENDMNCDPPKPKLIDHETIAKIKEIEDENPKCEKCCQYKTLGEFGVNEQTNEYYSHCITCREEARISEKKRKDDTIKILNDDSIEMIQCTDCKYNKSKSDYEMDFKKKKLHKSCKSCLEIRREKYSKRKDSIVKTEAEKEAKLAKNREYYAKNSKDIMNHKKTYRENRINNVADQNTKYCKKCNTVKVTTDFATNPKTKQQYAQCDSCRAKQ